MKEMKIFSQFYSCFFASATTYTIVISLFNSIAATVNITSKQFLHDGPLSFEDILPDRTAGYNKMAPPREIGHPTVVYFHVTVMSLDSIDESSMTYAADIFFAQSWKDWRLRMPDNMSSEYRLLPVQWLNDIWRPDSFFKNAKDVTFQEMTIPNHYIWLYKDKTILYMVKLTLLLSCSMNFEYYPHDTQECSMKIESLSHTTDDLVFVWDPQVPLVVDRIELPQLDLVRNVTGDCTQVYSTGNFTCLEVVFTFKRRLGYYLFHTYIPTCLIVIMSWISFWIRPEAVPARVTLGVTSLLTLATQHANSQKSLPPVSYIKAIDIFMSSCMIFVFCSLMEYALVNIVVGDVCEETSKGKSKISKTKGKKNQQVDWNELINLQNADKIRTSFFDEDEMGDGMSFAERLNRQQSQNDKTPCNRSRHSRMSNAQGQSEAHNHNKENSTSHPIAITVALPPPPPPPTHQVNAVMQKLKKNRSRAIVIDKISRILFPLSFTVLNAIYWCVFVIE